MSNSYVTDNADLIFLRKGLGLLLPKLATIINKLSDFARKYRDQACLGYTHGQPVRSLLLPSHCSFELEPQDTSWGQEDINSRERWLTTLSSTSNKQC